MALPSSGTGEQAGELKQRRQCNQFRFCFRRKGGGGRRAVGLVNARNTVRNAGQGGSLRAGPASRVRERGLARPSYCRVLAAIGMNEGWRYRCRSATIFLLRVRHQSAKLVKVAWFDPPRIKQGRFRFPWAHQKNLARVVGAGADVKRPRRIIEIEPVERSVSASPTCHSSRTDPRKNQIDRLPEAVADGSTILIEFAPSVLVASGGNVREFEPIAHPLDQFGRSERIGQLNSGKSIEHACVLIQGV